MTMTRYGMAIDLNRCFGCHTCAIACKVANNIPRDMRYSWVETVGGSAQDTASGEFPQCQMTFRPMQCQHCDEPACLGVCPTGATSKDGETGIVSVDPELCIGCESCIKACPYEGVRTLVEESPEYYLDMAVGEFDAPFHRPGTVEKCTFCKNLIDRGDVPACMQLCPGRARYWGDLDDPESEISKAMEGRVTKKLHEEAGTAPNVYYLA